MRLPRLGRLVTVLFVVLVVMLSAPTLVPLLS